MWFRAFEAFIMFKSLVRMLPCLEDLSPLRLLSFLVVVRFWLAHFRKSLAFLKPSCSSEDRDVAITSVLFYCSLARRRFIACFLRRSTAPVCYVCIFLKPSRLLVIWYDGEQRSD